MVKNSKEKLDFTEFRLTSRTKKDYHCLHILTIFERVVSFLDLLLIHLPISRNKQVKKNTYTNKGLVTSRKLVLLDNHSSFDTLGAERVSNTQNVYEPLEFC